MSTLTIDVPNELLMRIEQSGRSAQEMIVEALERTLRNEPTRDEIIHRLAEAKVINAPNTWDSPSAQAWRDLPETEKAQHLKEVAETYLADAPASRSIIRDRKRLETERSRAEMAERLIHLGIVRHPEEWDTLSARRWRELPDDEKRQFIEETQAMMFSDSPASSYIMANRR